MHCTKLYSTTRTNINLMTEKTITHRVCVYARRKGGKKTRQNSPLNLRTHHHKINRTGQKHSGSIKTQIFPCKRKKNIRTYNLLSEYCQKCRTLNLFKIMSKQLKNISTKLIYPVSHLIFFLGTLQKYYFLYRNLKIQQFT